MQENQKIIFPPKTTSVIFDILKKYGLEETKEQRFTKMQKGLQTNGAIIGELIALAATEKISLNDLALQIKTSFGLSQKLSSDLTRTIKTLVLDLCRYEEEIEEIETIVSPQVSTLSGTKAGKEPKEKSVSDFYREPIA